MNIPLKPAHHPMPSNIRGRIQSAPIRRSISLYLNAQGVRSHRSLDVAPPTHFEELVVATAHGTSCLPPIEATWPGNLRQGAQLAGYFVRAAKSRACASLKN